MLFRSGSENQDLPAFAVLPDPRGLPPGGIVNWGAGFLPAVYQATTLDIDGGRHPITDLFPPKEFTEINYEADRAGLDFLRQLNHHHLSQRQDNTELEARISAYELAARLQLSAPEVTDLGGESPATKQLFALDDPDKIGRASCRERV